MPEMLALDLPVSAKISMRNGSGSSGKLRGARHPWTSVRFVYPAFAVAVTLEWMLAMSMSAFLKAVSAPKTMSATFAFTPTPDRMETWTSVPTSAKCTPFSTGTM